MMMILCAQQPEVSELDICSRPNQITHLTSSCPPLRLSFFIYMNVMFDTVVVGNIIQIMSLPFREWCMILHWASLQFTRKESSHFVKRKIFL